MEPQTKGKADPELRGRLEEAASQHAYICMFISHSKGKAEGTAPKGLMSLRTSAYRRSAQKIRCKINLLVLSQSEKRSVISTHKPSVTEDETSPEHRSSDQNALRNAKNMFGQPSQSLHVDHFTLEGKNKRVKNVLNCNITCNKLL